MAIQAPDQLTKELSPGTLRFRQMVLKFSLLLLLNLVLMASIGIAPAAAAEVDNQRAAITAPSKAPEDQRKQTTTPPSASTPPGATVNPSTADAGAAESDAAHSIPATQPADPAREAFHRGSAAYARGNYQGAVDGFEEAYRLSARIEMLYNLANAYERLGDYRKASLALEVYLPHAPAASQPQLQERMERLHQQADRKKAQEDAHQRALEEAALAQEEVATVPVTRAVGYGALVAATASLGVGTGYVISAAARRRATLQDCVEVGTNVYCDTASESGLEQVRNRAITGYSLLAFGALAAGLGTYLIVISTPSQEKLELGVGWGTLDLRGEF